jgi:hypothetical protein
LSKGGWGDTFVNGGEKGGPRLLQLFDANQEVLQEAGAKGCDFKPESAADLSAAGGQENHSFFAYVS